MLMYKPRVFTILLAITLSLLYVVATASIAKNSSLVQEDTDRGVCARPLDDGVTGLPENETSAEQASLNSEASGPRALITNITFIGNSIISDVELSVLLEGCLGKTYDFEGLLNLAKHVTNYYRQKKFPFATAIFPPQTLTKGRVIIRIIEGQYGTVKTSGEEDIASPAADFLYRLNSGNVISEDLLNRTILIMEELPGISVKPTIAAGEKQGLGDLDVLVTKDKPWAGSISIDNHGEKSTGLNPISLNLATSNVDVFGDSLSISAIQANENLTSVDLKYDRPLGFSGARMGIEATKSQYNLGADFVGFSGDITKFTTTLSYPFILTPERKLRGSFNHNLTRKHQFFENAMTDDIHLSGFDLGLEFEQLYESKSGRSTKSSLRLAFDDFESALNSEDTQKYRYLTGWLLHREPINDQIIASVAWSFQNSSDQKSHSLNTYSLGGPNNIRAYSSDEISGPSGYYTSLELSYNQENMNSFVFYDFGEVSASSGEDGKSLEGAGLEYAPNFKNCIQKLCLPFRLKVLKQKKMIQSYGYVLR